MEYIKMQSKKESRIMLWLMNNGRVVNRSSKRHKELQESSVGKIWGAGSKKYLWTNPNNNN